MLKSTSRLLACQHRSCAEFPCSFTETAHVRIQIWDARVRFVNITTDKIYMYKINSSAYKSSPPKAQTRHIWSPRRFHIEMLCAARCLYARARVVSIPCRAVHARVDMWVSACMCVCVYWWRFDDNLLTALERVHVTQPSQYVCVRRARAFRVEWVRVWVGRELCEMIEQGSRLRWIQNCTHIPIVNLGCACAHFNKSWQFEIFIGVRCATKYVCW